MRNSQTATTVRLWKTVSCHRSYTMARLSTATRQEVVILRQQGLSQAKISKQTGVSRCAVQALLKKHKETGNVEDRRRSGRPRKLSAADERHLILTSLRNRKMSSSAISSELAETSGTQVHPSTIRRSLVRSGLHGRIAAQKPYLRRRNKAKRLNYAQKHTVTMADPWQECMDYAVSLARKAGEMIREALEEDIAIMVKSSPADLVTITDQKVEDMILSSIKEKYPSHSFIGEESVAAGAGSILTNNPTWIIDPIDGTTNFVHRFPFVAVSIGFVVNKQMEFGVVFSCVEDKMYTARKGKGAFCNGQKLHVSRQQDITKALLVTELGSNREPEVLKTVLSNMQRLLNIPIHGIRAVGTAAVNMCLVATGGADAYYEMGIHCWDMAGAGIIITEAGGVLLDISGGPFDLMSRRIIAANSQVLGERIAKELQIIPLQRDDATD